MREWKLLLCFCALLANTEQSPSFLITAPNIVHMAVEEAVAIQVHGANSPIEMTVYFEDEIKRVRLSKEAVFNLNNANSFHEIQKILIKPDMVDKVDMFTRKKKPYVLLVAESNLFPGEKRTARILLSTKKGYLFIQTDKPIYTPKENVKYRVFTLDNYMRPVNDTIQVRVLNPEGMTIHTAERKSQAMTNSSFEITDIAELGTWKITAWFNGFDMSKVSTEYEVRKYELPMFEVQIVPSKLHYLVTDEEFSFNIAAKHTYGKDVNGVAYVRFGVIHENGKTTFLPGLEQHIKILKGDAPVTLKTDGLEKKIQKRIEDLKGLHLYIAVTVVETASGEIREEECSAVKFVSSPYTIDLSKTKQFFIPGASFSVIASITNVDGSPASDVPVTAEIKMDGVQIVPTKTQHSSQEGLLSFQYDIPDSTRELSVMVTAESGKEGIGMTAKSYESRSKNFLSISVPAVTPKIGETLQVTLKGIRPQNVGSPEFYYYMILSKGNVVLMERIPSTSSNISLLITSAMVPAFRLIAYYFVETQREIVADSVWIDTEDVCIGKINVQPDKEVYEPSGIMTLEVEAGNKGMVALSIVDTAVFILNRKNKLTSKKVFSAMNAYDLGCSIGGGTNSNGVFTDAGLAFISDTISSTIREDFVCPSSKERSKRSAIFQLQILEFANKYQDPKVQKCCQAGLQINPMRFSCDKRLERVTESEECREAFKACCEKATALRKELAKRQLVSSLGRTSQTKDEDAIDHDSITLRSSFPESWYWNVVRVENPGVFRLRHKAVPDSITTWEIQAVHFHDNGFCIAEPKTFKVFKDFFLSLKLPYSLKRHEQLEVKAIVYNYGEEDIDVTVKMKAVDAICSPATAEKNIGQTASVERHSSVPFYFSVVPMEVGELPITVTAVDTTNGKDGIERKLNVVSEGILKKNNENTKVISGKDRFCKIDLPKPDNMIPGSRAYASVSFKGDMLGESIENCLSSDTIDKLIKVPTGCGEQTMVKMAPAMFAIEYLDASEQWVQLQNERKHKAVDMIKTGYERMLSFNKKDGSFAIYQRSPSSIWLTAFVAKVFSKCRNYIYVENQHIHKAVSYLIKEQQEDGSFQDPHPVRDRTMQGGVGVSGAKVSLTAYVIIALCNALESYTLGERSEVKKSIDKAINYLKEKVTPQLDLYSTAVTAYALKLVQPDSDDAKTAENEMRRKSTFDNEKQTRYWHAGTDVTDVETTAYALLQTLLGGDIEYAKPIAKWLTEKSNYGGGFHSTQDTVVALEALSKYGIQTLGKEALNLTLGIHRPGYSSQHIVHLSKSNSLRQENLKFDLGNDVTIDLSGTGTGVISVRRWYYSSEPEKNTCDHLHLSVTVEGQTDGLFVDDKDYFYDEHYDDFQKDDPISAIEWLDIQSRRRRDIQSTAPLQYKVCVRSSDTSLSTMFLVDITLLSGLEPITADLDKLQNAKEPYIDFYEFQKGRVLLYFGKITKLPDPDCVVFGVKQIARVGQVHPANAVLYDFYNPSTRCSIFYSAPNKNNMLSKLCQGSVCQCAEGPCPKMKNYENIGASTRSEIACESNNVNYAYVVNIEKSEHKNTLDYYTAKIIKIIKRDGDETVSKDNIRQFIARTSCDFKLKTTIQYLVMGKDGKTIDSNKNMQYFLDAKSWIEKMPSKDDCKASVKRERCGHLKAFIDSTALLLCKH